MENQNQGLDLITRSLPEFNKASEVLTTNKMRSFKAVKAGEDFIKKIEDAGGEFTTDDDLVANNYLAACSAVKGQMMDARKPFTQMFDLIRDEFTSAENMLDSKKNNTPAYRIQELRNAHARSIIEAQQKQADDNRKAAEKATEKASIEADIKSTLLLYVDTYTKAARQAISDLFTRLDLLNWNDQVKALEQYAVVYPYTHYEAYKYNPSRRWQHHDQAAIDLMYTNIVRTDFNTHSKAVQDVLTHLRDSLVLQLPERKAQLEQMAAANADEQKRMKELQEQADRDAKIKADQDAADKLAAQQSSIDLQQTAASTDAMFAGTVGEYIPAPETRTGYDCIVVNPAGIPLVFKTWFEYEGRNLTHDKQMKITIQKMCDFCGDLKQKNNISLESPHIKYEPTFKAVNRKQKI